MHHRTFSISIGIAVSLVISGNSLAAQLDSSLFNQQYNGDVAPVPDYSLEGTFIDAPTSDGSIMSYRVAPGGGYLQAANWSVSSSPGFTFEIRLKVDTDSPEGANGAVAFYIGDGSAGDLWAVGASSVRTAFGSLLSDSSDNTDDYHTFRFTSQEDGGGPANPTVNFYRDGVLIESFPNGGNWGNNVLYIGAGGSPYGGPTVHVDYIRWDNTGAYEPVAVPEPAASIMFFGIGVAGILRRRSR